MLCTLVQLAAVLRKHNLLWYCNFVSTLSLVCCANFILKYGGVVVTFHLATGISLASNDNLKGELNVCSLYCRHILRRPNWLPDDLLLEIMDIDVDTLLKFGETKLMRGLNILCGLYGSTNLEMVCYYMSC